MAIVLCVGVRRGAEAPEADAYLAIHVHGFPFSRKEVARRSMEGTRARRSTVRAFDKLTAATLDPRDCGRRRHHL